MGSHNRYAAEIGQWEDLLRLAGQDFPPIAESVDSGFQTSRAKLDFFSDLYEKLLNEAIYSSPQCVPLIFASA